MAQAPRGIKFNAPMNYFLVRYKEDSLLHICTENEVSYRRRRDHRVVAFALYHGVWYECKILCRDKNKKYLLQELQAYKCRGGTKFSATPNRFPCRGPKHSTYVLVQYHTTRDYRVLPSTMISKCEDGTSLCEVHCSDGVNRIATVIDQGVWDALANRAKKLNAFETLETPEKKQLRHPLLPNTPRVHLEKCRRFLNFQGDNSIIQTRSLLKVDEHTDRSSVDLPCESQECSEYSESAVLLESSDESDPYANATDTDEYIPSNVSSSQSTSSADTDAQGDISTKEAVLAQSSFDDNQRQSPLPVPASECSRLPQKPVVSQKVQRNIIKPLAPTTSRSDGIGQSHHRNRSACLFCKKKFVRLSRHLETVHKNQHEVASVLALCDIKKKRLAWTKLRNRGNYEYNCAIWTGCSEGDLLIQRKNSVLKKEDYLPCVKCRGCFKRQALYKHVARCVKEHRKYDRVQGISRALLPSNTGTKLTAKPGFKILKDHVYPTMSYGDITDIVQSDEVIIRFGCDYCWRQMQQQTEKYLANVVAQRMRDLAKLLKALRFVHGEDCSLLNFLAAERYDDICSAVGEVSGLIDGVYHTPSWPIRIRQSLKLCTNIMYAEASKSNDSDTCDRLSKFKSLLEDQFFTDHIARCRKQLKKTRFYRRSTTKVLPLVEDVLTFMTFLHNRRIKLVEELKTKPFSYSAWLELTRVLQCILVAFNRKRNGDVDKIMLECYARKSDAKGTPIYESLDESEKLTASSYVHFYTRGKKGSVVPIMIPKDVVPAVDLMLNLRESASVASDNPYLFGKDSISFYNAYRSMKLTSEASGIHNHIRLRSTSLRKQVATISQCMNLKDGDLDVLASFLGHSVSVHREFYRLPDEALHLARISKVLMAVSSNKVDSLRGRSLDELNVPIPNSDTGMEYFGVEVDDMEIGCEDHTVDAGTEADDIVDNTSDEDDNEIADDDINLEVKSRSTFADCTVGVEENVDVSASPVFTSSKMSVRRPVLRRVHGNIRNCIPWSDDEKTVIKRNFASYILEGKQLRKAPALEVISREPVLHGRSWRNVKDCVKNLILAHKRRKR